MENSFSHCLKYCNTVRFIRNLLSFRVVQRCSEIILQCENTYTPMDLGFMSVLNVARYTSHLWLDIFYVDCPCTMKLQLTFSILPSLCCKQVCLCLFYSMHHTEFVFLQAFVESSKLKRHQLVHTGEKPFQVSTLFGNPRTFTCVNVC